MLIVMYELRRFLHVSPGTEQFIATTVGSYTDRLAQGDRSLGSGEIVFGSNQLPDPVELNLPRGSVEGSLHVIYKALIAVTDSYAVPVVPPEIDEDHAKLLVAQHGDTHIIAGGDLGNAVSSVEDGKKYGTYMSGGKQYTLTPGEPAVLVSVGTPYLRGTNDVSAILRFDLPEFRQARYTTALSDVRTIEPPRRQTVPRMK